MKIALTMFAFVVALLMHFWLSWSVAGFLLMLAVSLFFVVSGTAQVEAEQQTQATLMNEEVAHAKQIYKQLDNPKTMSNDLSKKMKINLDLLELNF